MQRFFAAILVLFIALIAMGQSFDVRPSLKSVRSVGPSIPTTAITMANTGVVMLMPFGDSEAANDGWSEEVLEQFVDRYGFCGCTGAMGDMSTGRYVRCGSDGGAGMVYTGDLTKSFNTYYLLSAVGAYARIGTAVPGVSGAGKGLTGNVFEVTFTMSNGFGGFVLETNDNYGLGGTFTALTNIVANGTPYPTNITVRITNSSVVACLLQARCLSNAVEVKSLGMWDNTHPGVIYNLRAKNFQQMSQWNAVPTNMLGSELQAWASFPQLRWLKTINGGSTSVSNSLAQWLGTVNYWGGAGWDTVICGLQAVGDGNDANRIATDVALRKFAAQNGLPFFDTSYYLGNVFQMASRGLQTADGLHLSTRGGNIAAAIFFSWLNPLGDRGMFLPAPFPAIPYQLTLDGGLVLAGSDDLNAPTNNAEFYRNGALSGFVDRYGMVHYQPTNTTTDCPANYTLLSQLAPGTAATNNVQTTNTLFGTIGTGSTTLAPSYFLNTNRVSVLDMSGDYYSGATPVPHRFIASIDGAAVNDVEGLVTPPANVVQGPWVAHVDWNVLTNSASVGAYTIGGYVQFYGGAGATATLTNKFIVSDNFSTNHTIGLWVTNGPAGAVGGLVSRRAVAVLR